MAEGRSRISAHDSNAIADTTRHVVSSTRHVAPDPLVREGFALPFSCVLPEGRSLRFAGRTNGSTPT
jgi:hypothetical protein